MNKYIKDIELSNNDLKEFLGRCAIIEGAVSINENGYLPDIIKVLDSNIILELTSIYIEHNKLLDLVPNEIDTILLETTFTYQDKIYNVADFLIKLYLKTGWKPKRVVNTFDYGLEQLYIICNKLDIEVYKIQDSYDLDIGDFQLKKVGFNEWDETMIHVKYSEFENLVIENLKG